MTSIANTNKSNELVDLLKIPIQDAKSIIDQLNKNHLIDFKYKFIRDGDNLYIPLITDAILPDEIKRSCLIIKNNQIDIPLKFKSNKHKPSLKEALKLVLPLQIHENIPRAFDIIGKIAIIELNREEQEVLLPYKEIIAQTILKINPHISTVLEKQGDIEGVYRTRSLNYIAGIDTKTTLYKENNCQFKVNLENVFFTPRLGYERNRVSTIDLDFNTHGYIWDVFCGIGPFFIQIAKRFPNTRIIATDINADAIKLAKDNIRLNGITNEIHCFQQDVSKIPSKTGTEPFENSISRIIMNLPEKNVDFLSILPPFLHPAGTLLHIYQFNEKPDSEIAAIQIIKEKCAAESIEILQILNSRIVKPFSPAMNTTVIDLIIKRKEK